MIFISFFDEVSNLRNRVLTNQKLELVIRICQWNCMFRFLLIRLTKISPSKVSSDASGFSALT